MNLKLPTQEDRRNIQGETFGKPSKDEERELGSGSYDTSLERLFITNSNLVKIVLLWVAAISLISIIGTWVFHLLAPSDIKWITDVETLKEIKSLLVGITLGLAGPAITKGVFNRN